MFEIIGIITVIIIIFLILAFLYAAAVEGNSIACGIILLIILAIIGYIIIKFSLI